MAKKMQNVKNGMTKHAMPVVAMTMPKQRRSRRCGRQLRGTSNSSLKPQNQGGYNLNVQNLMLLGIKRWDHAKINLLFSEPEANNILAVPLLDMIQED
jgi:hypothetical protein